MRLAVLGSPIGHSRSPDLHSAAYRMLGLDWSYERIDVREDALAGFLDGLDDIWRGLSLTMPLKTAVLPLLDDPDPLVELTGAANTVVLFDGLRSGYNTDVHGVREALGGAGVDTADSAIVLGAGATASSAVVALAGLGVEQLTIGVRDVTRADDLLVLAERIGMRVIVSPLGALIDAPPVDVVVSTLPNGAGVELDLPMRVREHAVLLDAAYDPWPTPLAGAFLEVGGRVVSGLEMLLHQAVAQVRLFTQRPADQPLPGEREVVAAMRAAVGL